MLKSTISDDRDETGQMYLRQLRDEIYNAYPKVYCASAQEATLFSYSRLIIWQLFKPSLRAEILSWEIIISATACSSCILLSAFICSALFFSSRFASGSS